MDDYTYLPLFTYGTLMSDQPAFDLIAAAVERSLVGCVEGLVMVSVGRYPLVAPGDGSIIGEIHWLRPADFRRLIHELELYEGPEYTRARYQAQPLDGSSPLDVWLFIGQPAYAAQLRPIASGDWRAWQQQTHS